MEGYSMDADHDRAGWPLKIAGSDCAWSLLCGTLVELSAHAWLLDCIWQALIQLAALHYSIV